jgi:putative PEP-CTERM system histidine kinase
MIADIGYGLNAAGYVVLLLLLLTTRQSGVAKQLLIMALVSTVLWSLSFVTSLWGELTAGKLYLADTGKQMAWLFFLASCVSSEFNTIWQVLKRPQTLAILAVPLAVLAAPYIFLLDVSWFALLQTVLTLEILILLELVYRQAGDQQWTFKPLVLFLGAAQLYEFVLYANAIMVSEIDQRFVNARGFVYLLLAPFLVLAVRRIKHWGINIFVSRDVVLHSTLLLVTGVYLLVMSLAGYAVSFMGGKWSTTIQVIMYSGSIVLLVALFLSNQIRTKIKIFITKHFFANQYDYRLEWVRLTKILSAPITDIHNMHQHALTAFMSSIKYDQGMLLRIKSNRYDVLAQNNAETLSAEQERLLWKLIDYCEKTQWVLDLHQFKFRPYDYPGFPLSKDEVSIFRHQLVVPLIQNDTVTGLVLLNAIEKESVTLDWEVKDYLTAVTEQVATYLFHHEAAKSLAENAQFAAFNRMSAFVLHDLKNVLAQIDLILANAQQHKHNPEFIDDTFETLEHTQSRMRKMLQQLTEKNTEEKTERVLVSLSQLIPSVVDDRCQTLKPIPSVETKSECELLIEKEKVMNVLYHLINNAQQATADDGKVCVSIALSDNSDTLNVVISDTGEGMSETFIQQRLFTPFDTTKGNAGMGIGVYDARNYMDSIGGKFDVSSEVGVGTHFTLTFPISHKDKL